MLNILPEGIAKSFKRLEYLTSKLQRTAASIGFIQKALQQRLTPTFAIVTGNFASESDRYSAVKKILNANLRKHRLNLHQTNEDYQQAKQTCQNRFGKGGFKLLHHMINNDLRKERNQSLRTKNRKIFNLAGKRRDKPKQHEETTVPIFNLSDKSFPKSVTNCLRFGLNHSFVDKNRFIKVNLATELESLYQQVQNQVPSDEQEDFKHFLRNATNSFTENVYKASDNTWKSLRDIGRDPDLAVLSGDKDSSVVRDGLCNFGLVNLA